MQMNLFNGLCDSSFETSCLHVVSEPGLFCLLQQILRALADIVSVPANTLTSGGPVLPLGISTHDSSL